LPPATDDKGGGGGDIHARPLVQGDASESKTVRMGNLKGSNKRSEEGGTQYVEEGRRGSEEEREGYRGGELPEPQVCSLLTITQKREGKRGGARHPKKKKTKKNQGGGGEPPGTRGKGPKQEGCGNMGRRENYAWKRNKPHGRKR